MNEHHDVKEFPPEFSEEETRAWMDEHLPDMKDYVANQRITFPYLALSFVIGLAAHVSGYLLLSSATTEPIGLFADLLHALGWSLWTGVVVVVFLQVIPEAKRRQLTRYLKTYEEFQRKKAIPDT